MLGIVLANMAFGALAVSEYGRRVGREWIFVGALCLYALLVLRRTAR